MINSEEFSSRLQEVIEFFGETASSFSEKIGVQRSSISHILSGRNKPSLEFILKILAVYPEVELYWLLNGKGTFPSSKSSTSIEPPKETNQSLNLQTSLDLTPKEEKAIERIVIFYTDGSFKNYQN